MSKHPALLTPELRQILLLHAALFRRGSCAPRREPRAPAEQPVAQINLGFGRLRPGTELSEPGRCFLTLNGSSMNWHVALQVHLPVQPNFTIAV